MNDSSSSSNTNRHRRRHDDTAMPPPPPVAGPLQSQEGWVLFLTGIHEEAQEDDIRDKFAEYGKIKSIVLNVDRRTSLVKGYALVMFSERSEAQDALNNLHGMLVLGKKIGVHWTFCKSMGNFVRGTQDYS